MSVPDLQTLRDLPRPAWLWDASARRVVWANPAALAFFGEASLLDLAERPFDAREPGVAALAEAAGRLEAGGEVECELDFPSAPAGAPLKTVLRRHLLGDGRPGVLAVASEALPPERAGHPGLLREVLDSMPLPVAALDAEGALVYANPAALELFDEAALARLSGLFGAPELEDFLARARRAGTAAITRRGETRLGPRDIRITARLTERGGEKRDDLFTVMLEDVTERRALERAMNAGAMPPPPAPAPLKVADTEQDTAGAPPGQAEDAQKADETPRAKPRLPLSREDVQTFHRLSEAAPEETKEAAKETRGQSAAGDAGKAEQTRDDQTEDSAKEQPAQTPEADAAAAPARARKQPEEAAPRRERPETPALVRDVLDHRPEPILLHRARDFYYANTKARELFGFDAGDPAWDDMTNELAAASEGGIVSLSGKDGETRRFRLKRDVFPWRDGAVVQSTLFEVKEAGEAPEEEKGKQPAPQAPQAPAGAERGERRATSAAASGSSAQTPPEEKKEAEPAKKSAPVVRIVSSTPKPPAEKPREAEEAGETKEEPSQAASGAAEAAESAAPAICAPEPIDEELRAILDTAADGIITLNRQGEILSFSAGAEALFGMNVKDVAGTSFLDLMKGESRAVVKEYLDALSSDASLASIYNEGREVTARAAGGEIPLFLTIGRLGRRGDPDRPGKAAFCAVVRDITQAKKAESELRQAKEEAERSSAQKSEFLASISHELRTPLNAILGFSDVMRQQRFGEMGNEKYLGYARDIHESGEHLLSLINDLLDLSKIEAGKFELKFEGVDLAAVANDCLNLLGNEAGRARVILRKAIPANLPRVVADKRSMKQIFLNLLSNAIKFTPPGGQVMVTLKLNKAGELTASVSDTGHGMTDEELARALKPFERITGENHPDKPGTGLGLPLTKALTEANHARFEIASEPGKGTKVTITFPTPRVLAG